ncbi:MAG: IclR family transcriptional regulator [Micromonosporaceae bacterium]
MCSTQRDDIPKSVLARALTILTSFEAGVAEMTLADLTRHTGLPKPTVHRLVTELSSWGVLERTSGGIRLGMRLFELGQLAPAQRDLREAALPYLEDLRAATRATVHLAVLDGLEVVYIEKLTGRGGPELPSRVGGRMPTYCTAVGKALLAYSVPEVTHSVVDAGLVRRTPRTIVMPGLLSRELANARRRGVAFEQEESTPGVVCAACPVLDEDSQPVAGVSVSGWSGRLNLRRVAPAVRTATLGLSRHLLGGTALSNTAHAR